MATWIGSVLLLGVGLILGAQGTTYQVQTIAGDGTAGFSGDGGAALDASLFLPKGIAVSPDGTVFFSDAGNLRIRRLDPGGVIQTVAGSGGYGYGGDGGPATSALLSEVEAIALDAPRQLLYLADTSNGRIRQVDLATGLMHHVADLQFPQGVAVDLAGNVYAAETLTCRLFLIEPGTGNATHIGGNGTCGHDGDGGPAIAASFYFPRRLAVDASGNLFVIDTVSPGVNFAQSDRIRRIDAATGIVTTVAGGGLTIPGAGPATSMDLGLVTDIAVGPAPGGSTRLAIAQECGIVVVDLATGALSPFAGTSTYDGCYFQDGPAAEARFAHIDGVAYGPTGALFVSDSGSNRVRAITSGTGVGDDISYIGTDLTEIILSVNIVGGSVDISDNDVATTIDLGGLETVGGSVDISDNDVATTIDLGGLNTVGGSLNVTGNGAATVNLANLQSVTANMVIESTGTGTFDATACAGGSTRIDATGYATVLATTAQSGTTNVTSTDDSAISVALQPGTFSACVNFSLERVLASPESGTDANGNPVIVDTIDAYHIVFDVPTLGQPATLTFDIIMANLDPSRQVEVLEALDTGILTLVTKSDTAGSAFQAFSTCAAGEDPSVNGCVRLQPLDAGGDPTSASPAVIRFTGVVGHFSTWAVAILTSPDAVFNGLLRPYPAPPLTTTPTFHRGSVVPVKFNWVDRAGAVIDSATAAPAISILPGSCAEQQPATDAVTADAAGHSGWQYDGEARTWTFGWSTRGVAAGCYWIRVTTGTSALPGPGAMFPVALRDR